MKRAVMPTRLVRAVLDAGVDLYPADDVARERRSDALVARLEAILQRRRDAQGATARGSS